VKKILAVALAALLMLSCATPRVKSEVLSPAISAAWEAPSGVEADVERGIADAVEDGDLHRLDSIDIRQTLYDFDAAIESGSVGAIRARLHEWRDLAPFARRGVYDRHEDGELGTGGTSILLERIDNLTAALAAL